MRRRIIRKRDVTPTHTRRLTRAIARRREHEDAKARRKTQRTEPRIAQINTNAERQNSYSCPFVKFVAKLSLCSSCFLRAFVPSCPLRPLIRIPLTALANTIRCLPDWHRKCFRANLALPLSGGRYYVCNGCPEAPDGTTFAFDSSKDRASLDLAINNEKLGAKNYGKDHWH